MRNVINKNLDIFVLNYLIIITTLSPNTGIQDFFEENSHGILVSDPITLAIWEESNSDPAIYIFDPNPRSPTGMPLFTGTACLVSFVNSVMAADHIINCISQPELKSSTFTIFPVEIVVGNQRTPRKVKKVPTRSDTNVLPRCSKLVANKEKRLFRKIVSFSLIYNSKPIYIIEGLVKSCNVKQRTL